MRTGKTGRASKGLLPTLLALLGLAASGCGKSDEQLAATKALVGASLTSLGARTDKFSAGDQLLTRAEAKRLIESCYALAQADPERHQQICQGNPAVSYARDLLRSGPDDLSTVEKHFRDFHSGGPGHATGEPPEHPKPASPTETTPGADRPAAPPSVPAPKPPAPAPDTPQAKPPAVAAKPAIRIETDIRELSTRFARNAAHRNVQAMLDLQAHANVLHRDLTEVLGSEAKAILPENPLGLLDAKDLRSVREATHADQLRLEHVQAIAPSPELQASLDSVTAYLQEIDRVLQSDQPGKFHRARDALYQTLDVEKWTISQEGRESKFATEIARVREAYKATRPTEKWALWEPTLPTPPPFDPNHPRSGRVVQALSDYVISPHDGLSKMARLEAEFHELQNLPQEARLRVGIPEGHTTKHWLAENLSEHDLDLMDAWITNLRGSLDGRLEIKDPGWDLGPDATIREYLRDWADVLKGEWVRRTSGGGPSGDTLHPFESGTPEAEVASRYATPDVSGEASAAEKAAMVRLSLERYGPDLAHMPTATQEALKEYTQDSLKDAYNRASKVHNDLAAAEQKAALASSPLTTEEATKLTEARVKTKAALVQLDRVIFDRGKNGFYLANGERNTLNGMIRTLGDEPPPDTPSSPVLAPRGPPEPPPGGPAGVMLCDPVFEARLAEAQAALEDFRPALSTRSIEPKIYAKDTGRLVALNSDLATNSFSFDKLKSEPKARLDERYQDFRGRVDPVTNKPYPFDKVRELKSLAPVGGGIHMGEVASPAPAADLKDYVLRYDLAAKALVLIGPKGEKYRYGPVEPAIVKALLQFAQSGQNCAISIGWSGTAELANPIARQSGQPVLIDPHFVDTQIGRDLFLADKVPWALDKPDLAAGVANPIAAEFAKARKDFDERRQQQNAEGLKTTTAYLKDVDPFGESDTSRTLPGLSKTMILDVMISLLLSSETSAQAKERFLEKLGVSQDELDRLVEKEGTGQSDRARSLRGMKAAVDSLDKVVDRREALLDRVGLKVRTSLLGGKLDKDLFRLWFSLVRAKAPETDPAVFASVVLGLSRDTTLAVLIDEPTTFSLNGDAIVLNGTMRYRYVTQYRTVDEQGLRTVDPGDSTNEVRNLDELAGVVNGAYPKLVEAYEPLRHVTEYARVAAFLRWALKNGNLRGVDFSALAPVVTSDRQKTPTPDEIRF